MNIEKALVVDDSKVAHLTLRKLLTERSIEVDWVGSGEDAIAYMERQKPDIIFMDVMMPGMDGFETTATITNNSAIATPPPVIMCSANASEEDKQNAKECGATGFLSKPYTPAQMDQVLNMARDLLGIGPQPTPPAEKPATTDHSGPVEEAPPASTPPQSSNPAVDLERIAERAAWAMADKVARDVATEIAKVSAEQVARTIAEQTARTIVDGEIRKVIRTATDAAQEATSKMMMMNAAKNAASEVAQASAEKAVQVTLEQTTRDISENILKRSNRGLAMIRDELTKNLERHIARLVPETVGRTLTEPDFKQQLMPILTEAMHPMVETITRQAAAAAAQQVAVDTATTRKRTGLTLTISLIALIAAVGCAILSAVSL